MPITDEHKKSADKSIFSIFGLKGLTPKEKNQLFAEAVAKRNADAKTNLSKYKSGDLSKEQKMQKAQYGKGSYRDYAQKKAQQETSSVADNEEAGWLTGKKGGHENIDIKTPEQIAQTKELLELLKGKWKPLLEDMAKSPRTEMNQQIEDWFSHMNNPIVQSMRNQSYRTNPQVLFPSEMQQSNSNGQLEALLGGLAQQYGPDVMNYGYDAAKGMASNLGQYGQQMGGGLMDILSNLGNRFRSPQQ